MLVTLQQYNTDIYKLTTSFDLTSYDINSVDGGGETQNYQSYTPPPKLKLSFAMSWQNPSLLTYKHNHLLSLSKTLVQTTLKKTLKLASTKVMIHIISSFFFYFLFFLNHQLWLLNTQAHLLFKQTSTQQQISYSHL